MNLIWYLESYFFSPPHVIESFTTSAAPCSPSPQADDHAAADDIAAPSSPGAVEELCMEVTEHPEDESSTQGRKIE